MCPIWRRQLFLSYKIKGMISMYQYISKLLLNRGFFEVNGNLSKYLGAHEYRLLEDEGILFLERSFEGTNDEKNQVLDHVQDLSKRYSLTGANIRGGKLRVYLTRPGNDAEEEAIRVDFLTQSIESGIQKVIDVPATDLREPLYEENIKSEDEWDHIGKVDGSQPLPSNPVRPSDTAPLYTKEKIRARAGSHYLPPDENPNVPGYREPVTVTVIDRRFSFTGFSGAFLGMILGMILMGVAKALGMPSQYIGLFVPILVILIYRVMADCQMPISLGIIMVLLSLLGGSVLVNAIDILSTTDLGIVSSLKEGIKAHFDNSSYFVFNVWVRYVSSVLIAAIPAILLLSGGKKKTIVY